MLPLAVSGTIVIGAGVIFAVVLLWLLLRMDARDEAARQARERDSHGPPGPGR